MKKILYLHGFASSGASGTVGLLRKELWEKAPPDRRATIVAPDIPLDPLVAFPMSRVFPGGHRLNDHVVTHTLLPFIRELGV